MPVVLRIGPYRFFFYAGDRREPPHIHVKRDREEAKFWMNPVRLERNRGLSASELRRVKRHVEEHEQTLLREWDDYFNT